MDHGFALMLQTPAAFPRLNFATASLTSSMEGAVSSMGGMSFPLATIFLSIFHHKNGFLAVSGAIVKSGAWGGR